MMRAMNWQVRLDKRRKELGWTKAELSRRSDVPYDSVNKYLRGDVQQPRGDILAKLAESTGLNVLWLRDGLGPELSRVPVVGVLGAGEEWYPIDDSAQGGGIDDGIDFSLDDADPVALRVRGTSMAPVYRDGDKIICSRRRGSDISRCINRDCAVKTADGHGYIKILLRGTTPGTFRLRSYNPDYPDIEEQKLEWAAPVVWIKRSS